MNGSAGIRVLLVDDELAIRRALKTPLETLGFEIAEASRGEEALHLARTREFDIVLLDLNMPGMGGMQTLLRLRAQLPRVPILVLTVEDGEGVKVEALERGADDYITKPFSMRECIARIRSAVRRARVPERSEDAPVVVGEIELQPAQRRVAKAGRSIHLTRKEYALLRCLMLQAGRTIPSSKLLTEVWGAECREEVDYLRTFIRQLRKKLEDNPARPRYVLTDPYVGYRFADTTGPSRGKPSGKSGVGSEGKTAVDSIEN